MSDYEHEQDDGEYRLVVSFPDQSSSFVHGYEAGAIGYRMEYTAEQVIEATVHAENEEVFRRMGLGFGWAASFEPTEPPVEGWCVMTLRKLPTRKHLTVVK